MASKKRGKKNGGAKYAVVALIVVALIVLGIFLFSGGESYSQEDIDEFAKCLTESETKMYGAFWCPHCARTKKMFGSSFQYVTYVECDPRGEDEQSDLCVELEIENYDTWIFPDGSRAVGEPSFEELAKGSGCPAPEAK